MHKESCKELSGSKRKSNKKCTVNSGWNRYSFIKVLCLFIPYKEHHTMSDFASFFFKAPMQYRIKVSVALCVLLLRFSLVYTSKDSETSLTFLKSLEWLSYTCNVYSSWVFLSMHQSLIFSCKICFAQPLSDRDLKCDSIHELFGKRCVYICNYENFCMFSFAVKILIYF